MRVDGDAAQGFTLMFLRQWEFVTRKKPDYKPFLYPADGAPRGEEVSEERAAHIPEEQNGTDGAEEGVDGGGIAAEPSPAAFAGAAKTAQKAEGDCGCGGAVFLPFAAGLEYRDPVVRDVYANVIARANKKLYIMTPYFVPDETITDLLAGKALSGVDVRIVLPGVPDKKYVYLISLDNADKLTRSGVKVYTMSDAFVHTKSVLTENCAVIGSANFDLRSFFQQYENALYTDDAGVMAGLEGDFEKTFPECIQRRYVKTRPGFFRRLLTGLLQIFAPMM